MFKDALPLAITEILIKAFFVPLSLGPGDIKHKKTMSIHLNFLPILVLFATSGYSQIAIGPEAGVNFAHVMVNNKDVYKGASGSMSAMRIGAIADIPLRGRLHLQPGIFYSRKGRRDKTVDSLGVGGIYRELVDYIEVPVNAAFQLKIGKLGEAFIAAGPYLAYAFTARVKNDFPGAPETSWDLFSNTIGNMPSHPRKKRLDYGMNLSIGFRTNFGFFVRAQYAIGLANTANVDSDLMTIKNRGISVSLGCLFPITSRQPLQSDRKGST